MPLPYLHVENLNVVLKADKSQRLLRDVNLQIQMNQIHGVVGQSGAGKSTIAKILLNILPAFAEIASGRVLLEGEDLLQMDRQERRNYCLQRVSFIPQDPLSSLNPARRIDKQLGQTLRTLAPNQASKDAMIDLLEKVSIQNPEHVLKLYPHELSGGMRQRILIAMAFAAKPKLLIADEPTTALDVRVQKQILELILSIQKRDGMALMFVTHDLGVVANLCEEVTVLYRGHVFENRQVKDFFKKQEHDYSNALLMASPCHTRPKDTLSPVSDELLHRLDAEIDKIDEKWNRDAAN